MTRQITDIGIRALKPRAARYEQPAGAGLFVIVQPSGRKRFAVRYRYAGKTRKLTLQSGITLAAARKIAADAMYALEQGIDPAIAKRQQRHEARAAAEDTFEAVSREYSRRDGARLRGAARRIRTLERLVFPALGERPIGEIKRSEIIRLLDRIEDQNGPAAADGALALIRRIANWHASRSDDFKSPIVRGMARHKAADHTRSRILSDDELRAVWAATEADADPFGCLIRFLLLTACRREEATRLTWAELVGADWILPASRNKTKVELARPLSVGARAILDRLPRIAGCPYVFTLDGRTPLGGLGRRKDKLQAQSDVTDFTLHDLRRTARSLLSRAGVLPDHAERCLGHVIPGVRGVYDRHRYRDEMLHAYEALAAQIDRIVHPMDNVTALRG